MARDHKLPINKPMLEGLRKLLRNKTDCPLCKLPLYEHSYIWIRQQTGEIRGCSNLPEGN